MKKNANAAPVPAQLNPIDLDMLGDLDAAFDEVAAAPSIRTLLVTGAGRAFSAGGDLKKYVALQRDPVEFPRFVSELHRIFGRLRGKTESMQKAKHKNGRHRSPKRHAYLTIGLMHAVASFLVRGGEIRLST